MFNECRLHSPIYCIFNCHQFEIFASLKRVYCFPNFTAINLLDRNDSVSASITVLLLTDMLARLVHKITRYIISQYLINISFSLNIHSLFCQQFRLHNKSKETSTILIQVVPVINTKHVMFGEMHACYKQRSLIHCCG